MLRLPAISRMESTPSWYIAAAASAFCLASDVKPRGRPLPFPTARGISWRSCWTVCDLRMLTITFARVVLPDPLSPIMPSVWPCLTENEISLSRGISFLRHKKEEKIDFPRCSTFKSRGVCFTGMGSPGGSDAINCFVYVCFGDLRHRINLNGDGICHEKTNNTPNP